MTIIIIININATTTLIIAILCFLSVFCHFYHSLLRAASVPFKCERLQH